MATGRDQFIYKIGTAFPAVEPHEVLPVSDLDKKDGFIHLSTPEQVPETVGRFFQSENKIELLKIKTHVVEHKLKWEESSSHGTFPHIYGDILGSDIFDRQEFSIENPAGWKTLLSKSDFIQ